MMVFPFREPRFVLRPCSNVTATWEKERDSNDTART